MIFLFTIKTKLLFLLSNYLIMKINQLQIEIDGIDKEILRDLMEDARKPILQIANKIGISGAAIHQRLRKLEDAGVIAGSKVVIDSKVLGYKTMAFIGVGNQGTGDMGGFLQDNRVQVVAVCDVNFQSGGYWNGGTAGREPARRMVDEFYEERGATGPSCKAYVDYHDVLQRSDIDAVEIATPDHWHALCVLHAAAAKKDIYCQKPLALTVKQGRLMSDAVKKHKVIFQTGSQQKSDSNFRRAAELVRNGRIGKLQTVKVGLPSGRPDYGRTADKVTAGVWPDGFEYDRWLGPAPWRPYNNLRVLGNYGGGWRIFWDYGSRKNGDWGAHHFDIAQWAMGMDESGPR